MPYLVLTLAAAGLFALRVCAPQNLLDQDQERPATYVLDVIQNGNWICQRDLTGDITSKPPLWTWLSALASLAAGQATVFTLYLPGAAAAWGTAVMVFYAGKKHFGERAAWLAAIALLFTSATLKEFGLARTDGVFACAVTAAALLGFRAWRLGRGWTAFWVAAALATLAKGPLGVLLAGAGLLACAWERRSGSAAPLRGSQWLGLALFLGITGGWFGLSCWRFGYPVVEKMLGKELMGHAGSGGTGRYPGMLFYQQPLYYLGRAGPWSLAALLGLWRVWRLTAPSVNASAEAMMTRRFRRFLFCWFLFGLVIFSLAPHQRADLLWPILPAGALLAGLELARLTAGVRGSALAWWTTLALGAGTAGFGCYYFQLRPRSEVGVQSIAVKRVAEEVRARGGAQFPLTHVDDPAAFQFFLGTLRSPVSFARAAELLRGPEAAFVAVGRLSSLERERREGDPAWHVFRLATNSPVVLVGNRRELGAYDSFSLGIGPLVVRSRGARLERATERTLSFAPSAAIPQVVITNEGATPRRVQVCGLGALPLERLMGPGEVWRVNNP